MAHFVDTNVVVYAYSSDSRADQAARVLTDATINVQILNEFSNVALRKLGYSERELQLRIASIRNKVTVIHPIDELTHDLARRIAFRYGLAFYDAALLAAARLAGCVTFYSEDMQDGLVIEGAQTIRNPFA